MGGGVPQEFHDSHHGLGFLAAVLDSIDDAIVVIDRQFTIRWSNRAFRLETGRGRGEVVGSRCHEVSHHLDRPCDEHGSSGAGGHAGDCPIKEVFATGLSQEVMHTHYDGDNKPRYVEIKAYPVRGGSGEVDYAIEVIKDVTQRVHLEEELRHAQKMEAVGLLVGGVAHDFNNMLTAITGYGELLQIDVEEGSTVHLAVEEILSAAERATRLTRSLLAFSHKVRTEVGVVNLNEILRSIDKLLRRILGEDVVFDVSLQEGEIPILADRYQIEQVVMNLAANARDAMAAGDRFAVATEVAMFTREEAYVCGLTDSGSYGILSVSDTGTGIDEETRARIFEPFFTTKPRDKGTGLGLSMVSRIVANHGGQVSVESRQGLGTTFRIILPLWQGDPVELSRPEVDEEALPVGAGETILVGEDDVAVRRLLVQILEAYGYQVVVARNGADVLANCRERGDGIDLYILDVVMPGKGGEAILRDIRLMQPAARVLFVSGYPEEVLFQRGFPTAENALLVKPVSRAVLLRKVREMLGARVG